MKGHPEVIQSLQERLSEELAAILQYMVHAEMAENWGFKALAKHLKAHAITEMRHAEKHIERILFLEGWSCQDVCVIRNPSGAFPQVKAHA
jgi:bacterioferritin